jgi:hypothetical protein
MLDVIDLDRYPIDDPDLVGELNGRLDSDGVCELPGFVRTEAVAEAVAETAILAELWFATDEQHTASSSRSMSAPRPATPACGCARRRSRSPDGRQTPDQRLYENDLRPGSWPVCSSSKRCTPRMTHWRRSATYMER